MVSTKPALITGYCTKCFGGETPYILMISFKLWEPVYFQNCTYKSGKVIMYPRRFFGFAWNVGDPMNFKLLQFNTDLHKHNVGLHRGVVIPSNSEEIEYNSALAPKSYSYLPEVILKGFSPSKPSAPEHQGTMNPQDIAIAEGGGKRHKPSNSSLEVGPGQTKED